MRRRRTGRTKSRARSRIREVSGTLGAVSAAWRALRERCLPDRITVVLDELSPDPWQHVDLLEGADTFDGPLDCAIAEIPDRFGVRSIRRGETGDPTGPYTGLKISSERVPSLEEAALFRGPRFPLEAVTEQ